MTQTRLRARVAYATRAAASVILLFLVVSRVDWAALVDTISHARVALLAISLVTIWLAVAVRAYSFAVVVNRPGRLITLGDSMRLTLAGSGASLVLPGPASDLLKAHLAWRQHGDPERIATATVIDKITSLVAVGLVAAAFATYVGRFDLALVGVGVLVFASVPLVIPSVVPWRLVTRMIAPGATIDARRVQAATSRDGLLYAYVVLVSAAGWLISFGAIALVCRALGQQIPYSIVVVAGCAMTLASLLPLSIAGLGISQVGLVGALGWFAVAPEAGASIALVHLTLVLTPAIAGALTFARPLRTARPETRREAPARVAMLTTVYPRYAGDATGSFVAALATHLAASGLKVTAFAPHAQGLASSEELDGVSVVRFRYLPEGAESLAYAPEGIPARLRAHPLTAIALLPFLIGLARASRHAANDADVLHAHWAPVALIATLASPRAPVVVTLHGTDVTLAERSALWRIITLAALRRVRLAICVSRSLEARVRALPRFPDTPMAVIGNGVQPDLFVPREHARVVGPQRVLFVGRLTDAKGALDLLQAFGSVAVDAVLEYVGTGALDNAIAERLSGAAMRTRVSVAGTLDHASTLERIAQADLVIVPSRHEGFSLVALEAAALGVPCIGTRVGVLPELLHSDALVDVGDIVGLGALMSRVLSDPGFADRLAAHARARARAYAWPRIVEQTLAAYGRADN